MPAVRILLLGDPGSGKSSLFLRFHKDEFSFDVPRTLGVNYQITEVDLRDKKGGHGNASSSGVGKSSSADSTASSSSSSSGKKTRLQLWDFAGKYRYKSMSKLLIDGVHGVILVFDVSRRASFESLDAKLQDIFENVPNETVIHLCANKVDLPCEEWAVQKHEWIQFANDHCLPIYETSAASGANIDAAFSDLAYKLVDSEKMDGKEDANKGKIGVTFKKEKLKGETSVHATNDSPSSTSVSFSPDSSVRIASPKLKRSSVSSTSGNRSPGKDRRVSISPGNSPRIQHDRRGRVINNSANVPSSRLKSSRSTSPKYLEPALVASTRPVFTPAPVLAPGSKPTTNTIVNSDANQKQKGAEEKTPLIRRQKRPNDANVAAIGTYEISGKLYDLWSTRIWAVLLSLVAIVLTLAISGKRSHSGQVINRYKESFAKLVYDNNEGVIGVGQRFMEKYGVNVPNRDSNDINNARNSSSIDTAAHGHMRGTNVVPYAPIAQVPKDPVVGVKNVDLLFHAENCTYEAHRCMAPASSPVNLWVPLEGGLWPTGLSWRLLDPTGENKALYAISEHEARVIMTNDYSPSDHEKLSRSGSHRHTCDTFRTTLCLEHKTHYTLHVDSSFSNAHQLTICNQKVSAGSAIEFSADKKASGGCDLHHQGPQQDYNIVTTTNATQAEMELFASKQINISSNSFNEGVRRVACIGDGLTTGEGAHSPSKNSYPQALSRLLGADVYLVQEFGRENATAQKVLHDASTGLVTNMNSYWTSSQFESSQWFEPNIVCIMLGLNDAKKFNWNDVLYERDLTELVTTYQSLPSRPLLYLMIPPNIEPTVYVKDHELNAHVIRYHIPAIMRSISLKTNASIIDLSMLFQDKDPNKVYKADEAGYWSIDGVHPLDAGYNSIAKIVADRIRNDDERRKEGIVI